MTALTIFGTMPKDSIFLPQTPYSVRNDCQKGLWKVGDDDHRGNSIEISIIKVSQMFGSLGKTTNTQWLQVWFVPAPGEKNLPSNTVCVTYMKTRSVAQFSQKVTELMASGEPGLGVFTASFEKHSGDLGTYYSVQWDWRERNNDEEKEQLNAIASFLQSQPALIDMNTARNLVCIDGMPPDELMLLIESTKEQPEESKQKALPTSRK